MRRRLLLVIMFAGVLAVSGFTMMQRIKPRWEYSTFTVNPNATRQEVVGEINKYGEQGWELVTVDIFSPQTYYFKRQK